METVRVFEVTPFGVRNVTPSLIRKINAMILDAVFPAETVRRSLRFATKLFAGDTHNHIVNDATFAVETESGRTVEPGDSLCLRRKPFELSDEQRWRHSEPTCPGCIAIAQGLAARGY